VPIDTGITAIVLAAGASRRFGPNNKLLAEVDGVPLVCRVVDAIASGGAGEIVVVTGHEADAVKAALEERRVSIAHNPNWQEGMGTSVARGVAAIGESAAGALIVPGDMPSLPSQLISALIEAFAASQGERIVYPVTAAGEQRNPVLWPRSYFFALTKLSGATGAKQLLARHADDCVALAADDEEELEDIDTPEALSRARERVAHRR
jgi:molybdenum cofactor cytidylyltransferase